MVWLLKIDYGCYRKLLSIIDRFYFIVGVIAMGNGKRKHFAGISGIGGAVIVDAQGFSAEKE